MRLPAPSAGARPAVAWMLAATLDHRRFGVDDDPDDTSVRFLGSEFPRPYLALAESHVASQMINLFAHELQQLWMKAARLIFALLAAERHECAPAVLQM